MSMKCLTSFWYEIKTQKACSPSRRAFVTIFAADLLITCTTYNGQLAWFAIVMALLVASAST